MAHLATLILALTGLMPPQQASPETADHYQSIQELQSARSDTTIAELTWLRAAVREGYPLTDTMRSRLRFLQNEELRAIEQVTSMAAPDFQLDWEGEGFGVLLPHLGAFMSSARAAGAQLQLDLASGHGDTAPRTAKMACTLSLHVGHDPCLLTSLVSMSMTSQMLDVIEDSLDRQGIDPTTAQQLTEVLESIDVAFRLPQALDRERLVATQWMPKTLGLDNDSGQSVIDPEGADALASVTGSSIAFAGMSKASVRSEIDQVGEFYDAMASALEIRDRARSLDGVRALQQRVDQGEFGLFAGILAPNMTTILEKRNTIAEQVESLTQTLRAFEAGQSPNSLNAAWAWMQAAELADEAGPEWTEDSDVAAEIEAVLVLADARRTAGFPPPWGDYLEPPVPWWLPGQDALLRGLLDSAERAVREGRVGDAVNDLDRVLRIVAALSDHPSISSGLLAAAAMTRAATTLASDALRGSCSNDARARLLARIRAINSRDPAGLRRATSETRRRIDELSADLSPPLPQLQVPELDEGLLNAIAWLRGSASAHDGTPIYVVPGGDASKIELFFLDAESLDGWRRFGAERETPLPFTDLGAVELAPARTSMQTALDRSRTALRPGQ